MCEIIKSLGPYHNFKKFGKDNYSLEVLKLDLFVKFYDILGYSIIIESLGQSVILVNSVTVAKLKNNGNITVPERLAE